MNRNRIMSTWIWVMLCGVAISPCANAQVITVNSGFESGFTGWTVANQAGSVGNVFLQSGTVSPVSAFAVPSPPSGLTAAMSDANGPGTHVLYQDFGVPVSPTSGLVQFDLFIGNRATNFFTPTTPSLDFSTPALNQQIRVDILTSTSDPFSVAASDVLFNVYQSSPGNPLVSGYSTVSANIAAVLAAHPGETLRLRFAEVDNVFAMQMGIDNAFVAVPEPTSFALCVTGGLLLQCRRRRKSQLAQKENK